MAARINIYSILSLLVLVGCGRADLETASYNLPEQATHELREVFRVTEPAEGVFFTRIRRIHLLLNGNLIVSDTPNHQLYEFSPEGALINIIGREGRGPGEFQDIDHTFVMENDSLHVIQHTGARHQVLVKTEGGGWVQHREREFVREGSGSLYEYIPVEVIPGLDGSYMGVFPIYSSLTDSVEGHNNYYTARVDHNLVRTSPINRVRRVQETAGVSSPSFFRGFYNYDTDQDEVIYITNTSNQIIAIDSVGTERVSGLLPFERFPARRDSALEAVLAPIREYGMLTSDLQTAAEQTLLPHEPYYWRVVFDRETDRLWVNLARSDGGPNWMVSTLDGEVLYSFYGPSDINLSWSTFAIQENRIYGVIEDSTGVEYLAGFELVE